LATSSRLDAQARFERAVRDRRNVMLQRREGRSPHDEEDRNVQQCLPLGHERLALSKTVK